MERSPYWETNSRLPSQEIPCRLWNSKVQSPVHKIPPMDPIPSNMNPIAVNRIIEILGIYFYIRGDFLQGYFSQLHNH